MKLSDAHKKALFHMDDLDFESAASVLENIYRGDPSWPVANDLALCRFMQGYADEAKRLLDSVLAKEPGNGFAFINRFYLSETEKLRSAPAPQPSAAVLETKGKGPNSPLVSVVMPTFNRAGLIEESVESVLGQTMTDFELIVVNDGGDREVEKTLEPYFSDPRMRYVFAEHRGLSSARNAGMHMARGRYISQLDDDDVYYPHHLDTVMRVFEESPDTDVVYTDAARAFQEKRNGQWETVRRKTAYSQDFDPRELRWKSYIPVVAFVHKKECVNRAGWYNEHILRAMDWEFLIRLSKCCSFRHVKKTTCEQRERADRSQMTRSFHIPRNYYRNMINYLHGFFPLTSERFLDREKGNPGRLKKALDRLVEKDREEFFLRRLELRKLLSEPYYAMFYTLGKRAYEEGHPARGRQAFKAAFLLRPYEVRVVSALIRSGKD